MRSRSDSSSSSGSQPSSSAQTCLIASSGTWVIGSTRLRQSDLGGIRSWPWTSE